MTQFEVLGPLEVLHEGRVCTPTPPKVRTVLALLLLRANQVVMVDSLIRELWGDQPTRSAVTTIQTYIYHLRKLLARERIDTDGGVVLDSRAGGYVLRLRPEQLDAEVFKRLVDDGRQLIENDRAAEGSAVLVRALALWKGAAVADVGLGPALEAHAIHLEEQRIRALELRIQADVALGRHRELIGELRYLVGMNPLNEWFHRQLITVLGIAGRRCEALQSYHDLRRILNEELGLEPSPELQRLQRQVLAAGLPEPSYGLAVAS
jgi:DNA-binding SARP family transcriptional activator